MLRLLFIGITVTLLSGTIQAGVLQEDAQNLLTYTNLSYMGLGAGMASLSHVLDNKIDGSIKHSVLLSKTSTITNIYGESLFDLSLSLSLWLGGKVMQRPQVEALGSNLIRTLLFTQGLVGPIKLAVRRPRPDRSDKRSFPSGHTANSFAMGRLLHRQYGVAFGVPMYFLGGLVAVGRLEDRHHYFSDVVMGAVLGTIVGNSITLKKTAGLTIEPSYGCKEIPLLVLIRW